MDGERREPSYSNPIAAAAFWCGLVAFASLVSVTVRLCVGGDAKALDFLLLTPCLGAPLSPCAMALAFLGLRHARQHKAAGGFRLALTGLIFGSISTVIYLSIILTFNTAW